MKRAPRKRLYSVFAAVFAAIVRFVHRYPWMLCVVPLAVFFPLLDSRGLYEYGDANFPLNPFWTDYILPWSGAASAGADNTFIGVPRLVYHVGIDALIATFHNLQTAQWLWYSAMTALGLMGAFALARRLGAGVYSAPAAIFYSMNLWSYDRIAQGPIYLSYQALPLVVYLFLRYLARPGIAAALYFACSLLLVIPALQISYLAALACLGIAVREIVLRGWRVVIPQLALLAAAVVAANAFYVFSMIADMWLNSGGNIALVNQRFDIGVFEHYAANIGIFNTLRLQSFYYTSIARQPAVVGFGVLLVPLLLLALLLVARRPAMRSRFYAGAALALLGIWLVDGFAIAPAPYEWLRNAVPGLRSFVEPDYFSPLYVLGAFVMFAAGMRLGARAFGLWWTLAAWVMALSGIVAFLPIDGQGSGMPQTPQPRQYTEFSRADVLGNTLWIPPDRGVEYRWSPYVINGFTSLNSPSDAIGPTMAEWVAPGTARVQKRLADGFMAGQLRTVEALAPILGVGTVAVAADSLGPSGEWPNPEITGALRTFDALTQRRFLRLRDDYRDDRVHLVTGTAQPPLPEFGLYDAPVNVGGFDNYMWWMVLSGGLGGPNYVPVAADVPAGAAFAGESLAEAAPPPLTTRRIPVGAFATIATCSPGLKVRRVARVPHAAAALAIRTGVEPQCLSMTLPNLGGIAALTATIDGVPADAARLQLMFGRNRRDLDWIDPTDPAQEVPDGARTATLIVRIAAERRVVFRGLTLRYARRTGAAARPPSAKTCAASGVTWSEQNPLAYTVRANVRGRCTLVFRQSFAPIWAAFASGGSAKVLGHLQVDGFANGWIVEASGPVTFRIVDRALFAYAAGMILTLACVLLAIGFAIRAQMRRAARRASRVPSPA